MLKSRFVTLLALLVVVLSFSACVEERRSINEIASHRANQVLVNQGVDVAFLESVSRCPSYASSNFRQIGDGIADARKDVRDGFHRLVLIDGSLDVLETKHGRELLDCIGEPPPVSTIWVLSNSNDCGLIVDTSITARKYASSYSTTMVQMLAEELGCGD